MQKRIALPTGEQLECALTKAMNSDGRLDRTEVDRQRLAYVYELMQPASHTECCIVVWAGFHENPDRTALVKEYCRRRNHEPSGMFDHPALALESWHLPDTQRLLVFKEHLYCLVQELTGFSDGRKIVRGIYQGESHEHIGFDAFLVMCTEAWRSELSVLELKSLYALIHDRFAVSLHYYWCSSIVENAIQIIRQQRGGA